MANKFYAVKKGANPGIYSTWSETEVQIKGFNGAQYKSFKTLKEAKQYLSEKNQTNAKQFVEIKIPTDIRHAIAYSDGSYDINTDTFSYGVVILWAQREFHFSKRYSEPLLNELRNVIGEITGAKRAMRFCVDNNIPELTICYDYEGVEKWATKKWKANIESTKQYQLYVESINDKLDIHYVWVKGHSGDHYNDMADYLAYTATLDLYFKEVQHEKI